jgi:hypothetical protein
LGKLISISVWIEEKDRSILVDERFTEEDAARMRGYIAWKIMNKRAMDERDGLYVAPEPKTPRPWPPSVSKPEQTEKDPTPADPSP